ncbi:hypothetical protein Btru_063259 [Bulinus truncatus]|nr:hypothetical protein Btru_063259 [Bulinus truncatus]
MPGPKKDAAGGISEAGDMVVYVAGFPAIYGKQPLYFKDPVFAARAADAAAEGQRHHQQAHNNSRRYHPMKSLTKRLAIGAAVAVGALGLLTAAAYGLGLRINTSKSIPKGLYVMTKDPITVGSYVILCPPDVGVFREAKARGYLGPGHCPGGYGNLMKRVLAAKEDVVTVSPQGLTVNGRLLPLSQPLPKDGAGRPMPAYQATTYTLGNLELLLMSDVSSTSFDGRYFGPVNVAQTGKGQGYIECGQVKVTWCFGHMLEQAEPDEYTPDNVPRGTNGKKVWRTDELPIIPNTWLMRPKPDAEAQLAVIRKLIQEASEIVNAGDPDREGQLLVDEVLEHFGNKKPVLRYWASARDAVSVKRALGNLKTNDTYTGWGLAAKGRARADWLIGMNLTRAYTLRAQRGGSRALLAVGRVQTPTLALVVSRDREIENFKPVPYFTLAANIAHQAGTFAAAWRPREDQAGLDPDGRLIDKAQADALVAKLTNKPATIEGYEQAAKKQGQPLGLSLTALTALAAKRWGYTADQILKACQASMRFTSSPATRAPIAAICPSLSTPTRPRCSQR